MAGHRPRRAAAAVAALVVLLAAAGLLAACGHKSATSNQTPVQRFTAILGHRPTGLAATIAARGTLVVGEDPEFAPQSTVDSAGTWSGFDVDVAREVASVLGLKVVEIHELDWARVPAALKADSYDVAISSMTTDPKPSHKLAFARPYAYSIAQVAVPAGGPTITSLSQLSGKTIGASASTTFQRFLEAASGVSVALYGSDADALTDVGSGRLAGDLTADTTIKSEQAGGAHIAVSSTGFFYQPQAFATRQGESDLVTVLNAAVKAMRVNGSLAALSRKWYDGLNVSAAPAAAVPSFSAALAMLKAGTYPAQ
jgi:ABC-type amino acid transport substrate-binding protein